MQAACSKIKSDAGIRPGGSRAIKLRLQKLNCQEILTMYRLLIQAGKLPEKHYTDLLYDGWHRRNRMAHEAKLIGRQICRNALNKYGAMAVVANKLGISNQVMNYWLGIADQL